MTKNGFHNASNSEDQVREWWTAHPEANAGIALGISGIVVLDCDHGLTSFDDFVAWRERHGLPETYTVRTGRRDSFGVQLCFTGARPTTSYSWDDGTSGEVRSIGAYAMAAGSTHPDTKERYEVIVDAPIVRMPDVVRAIEAKRIAIDADKPITENRNIALTSIAGKLRNAGLSRDALEVALLQVNADRCAPPLDEDEVKQIAEKRWEICVAGRSLVWSVRESSSDGVGAGRLANAVRHQRGSSEKLSSLSFLSIAFLRTARSWHLLARSLNGSQLSRLT